MKKKGSKIAEKIDAQYRNEKQWKERLKKEKERQNKGENKYQSEK